MHDHRSHEGASKLYELVKDVKFAMMTTVEPDGTLHSRPMYNQEADEHGDFWFFTKLHSPKVEEISKDNQINLSFADPSSQTYVSISGKAEVSRDKTKINEKWSEGLKTWFPKGKDDPDTALIRVTAEGAQYWDSTSSGMVYLFEVVRANLTGSEPKVGEARKLDL